MRELSLLFGYKRFIFDIQNTIKNRYTVYYIDITLLWASIRCFKMDLVLHCWMLNDIFNCDVMQWNKRFIWLSKNTCFNVHLEISVFHWNLYVHVIFLLMYTILPLKLWVQIPLRRGVLDTILIMWSSLSVTCDSWSVVFSMT
jgi:hypothetical protein